MTVFGPKYTPGSIADLRAVSDFTTRTVRGFMNDVYIGKVPFAVGTTDDITFVNLFMGSIKKLRTTQSFTDEFSVRASAIQAVRAAEPEHDDPPPVTSEGPD